MGSGNRLDSFSPFAFLPLCVYVSVSASSPPPSSPQTGDLSHAGPGLDIWVTDKYREGTSQVGRREGYLRHRVSPTESPEHTGSTGRRRREGGCMESRGERGEGPRMGQTGLDNHESWLEASWNHMRSGSQAATASSQQQQQQPASSSVIVRQRSAVYGAWDRCDR